MSINGKPAPKCSLKKEVKWVISDRYGSGNITNGGNTMNGLSTNQYSFRIGWCVFESGVHTWKVELRYESRYNNLRDKVRNSHSGNFRRDNDRMFCRNYDGIYGSNYKVDDDFVDYKEATGEVGIIDSDEINTDIANSQNKWVYQFCLDYAYCTETVFLTLDMEKKTLETRGNFGVTNYQFTSSRVIPFFSSNSSCLSLHLVE